MTACAIVQARMGSSRFPGKMLREIAGKPLIWHVIHRLRQCRTVSQIILATSDNRTDDSLAAYVQSLGIAVVRGPEQNVLQRFALALPLTGAETLLRITGDSPLIDPSLIDRLVTALQHDGGDYVTLATPVSDCGIDPVSRRALLRLLAERAEHPVAVEHVTGYFGIDPGFAQRVILSLGDENRLVDGARFSIDTPADLAFMEEIYRRLGAAAGDAPFLDALELLRADPDLMSINAHIRQRRADEKPLSVVVRCDGGHDAGLGHVVRCLAIAATLRDRFSAAVTFALRGDAAAFALIRTQAFAVRSIAGVAPATELAAALDTTSPDIVLLDIPTPFDSAEIDAVRKKGCRLAILDDASDRRLHADIGFFPPTGATLDWRGAVGKHLSGFEWIPLRPQFAPPPARRLGEPPMVLVTAGGSDPAGIGRRWIRTVARVLPSSWRVVLVLGAAATEDPSRQDLLRPLGDRVTVRHAVADMAYLMSQADLALASFGMTAYELAAVGVPMLLLCLSDDHLRSAKELEAAGAARILGLASEATDDALDQALIDLCADRRARDRMSRLARQLVDGHGARRIAEQIAALVKPSFASVPPLRG